MTPRPSFGADLARRLASALFLMGIAAALGGRPAFAQQEAGQSETTQSETARPNILMLYADDLDPSALGFMGNDIIRTPNIDRLARRGVAFRNAFVTTATCVTSRGNMMTGRYAARTGIYFDQFDGLGAEEAAMTVPRRLHEAGYHTGYVGKWHLGEVPERMFDDDRSFRGQGHFWTEERPPDEGPHLTRRLGTQATAMIREAPADRPFAITVGFKAPHVQDGFAHVESYPPMPSTATLYELDSIPAPPLSSPEFFESQPAFLRESLGRTRWDYRLGPPSSLNFQRSLRRYYRMVTGVDRQVGRIVEALREAGRLENTIIVVTADHGLYLGERGRAGKWLGHDTSIRVPLVVVDPRLPAAERGTWREEMVLSIDLHPTMLDWAGVSPEAGVQGRSFAPLVAGEAPEDWREAFFYEHHSFADRIPRSEGVRTERYKYLRYLDSEPLYEELYDLRADPQERTNLADDPEHAGLLEEMRARWEAWRQRVRK